MINQMETDGRANATQKIGCRFTPAEAKLLDLLATVTGTTTSNYFRKAVKRQMFEDLLETLDHHSTAKTEEDIEKAAAELKELFADKAN